MRGGDVGAKWAAGAKKGSARGQRVKKSILAAGLLSKSGADCTFVHTKHTAFVHAFAFA